MNEEKSFLDDFQERVSIFSKSLQAGVPFKQSVAETLAGPEFDYEKESKKIDEIVSSNPCVLFSWTVSPSCKKAKALLSEIGCSYKSIELNEPWSEGNLVRAALGRKTGKSSVPSIWINGKYIGGCDDGPTDESPGLVKLAFRGTLRPMLIAAGVLKPVAGIDHPIVATIDSNTVGSSDVGSTPVVSTSNVEDGKNGANGL